VSDPVRLGHSVAKFDQAGLLRMQRQRELLQPVPIASQKRWASLSCSKVAQIIQ
jgi:hypothetical protein